MKRKHIIRTLLIAGTIISTGGLFNHGSMIISTLSNLGVEFQQEASAATTEVTQGGITFQIDTSTNTACVSKSTCTGVVAIPSTVNGAKVTSIGRDAFKGCTELTSVTIPNSVTIIEGFAFEYCTKLTSITIPNSVTNIGVAAFWNCISLNSVEIPDSVITIGNGAFKECTKLTSVTISNSVTSMGEYTFQGCTGLTSISIPHSLTALDSDVFQGCTALTSVTIPNSVTTIGSAVFNGCTRLTSIIIPNSVTIIGNNAFKGCTKLTSIIIPNSVTSIGNNAFKGCDISTGSAPLPLKGTEGLPNNLTFKYKGDVDKDGIAYSYTDSTKTALKVTVLQNRDLSSLDIPASVNGIPVTTIGDNAFKGCKGLASVEIPNSITSIGKNAFEDCTALASIKIPNSVTTIGIYAFSGCTGLTYIEIPNSVTSIGFRAFCCCKKLTSLVLPDKLKVLDRTAIEGTSIEKLEIPDSVESLTSGYWSLPGTLKLIKIQAELLAPDSAQVEEGYFKVYLVDEDEATTLGSYIVKQGTNLQDCVDIPAKYGATFEKWTKASTSSNSVIGNIQDNCTFIASYKDGVLNLPSPTVALNKETTINRDTTVKAKIENMQAGLTYIYTLDGSKPTTSNGTLLTGDTINIPKQDTDSKKTLTVKIAATTKGVYSAIAEDSVTFLAGTISNDPTKEVEGVTYSMHSDGTATVKSALGKSGNVVIPYEIDGNKVTEIGQAAFKDCVGINSVTIPNTITTLGAFAFQGCTGLKSIEIPQSITSLEGGTFSGCTGLSDVRLPDSITSMKASEFENCDSLDSIKANALMLNRITLNGFNKVRFMDNDEATYFGGWYVKSGMSMVGEQLSPIKRDYTFNKWTRYTPVSVSTLADIEDNVTFMAVYDSTPGTPGAGQLIKPILTPNKTNALNREIGIIITAK